MIGNQDVRFFVALDLGAAGEYTALAVIERPYVHRSFPRAQRRPAHSLRYLRRFPIGMSYPEVFEELRQLIRKPPLPGCILGVDETGVGRSVASLLKDRLKDPASGLSVGQQQRRRGARAADAIRIGAPVQKKPDRARLPREDRVLQRRRVPVVAGGSGHVHVGAGVEEESDRVE